LNLGLKAFGAMSLLKTIRSFYYSSKLAKIVNSTLSAFVVITGVAIAEQALEAFFLPQVIYAEEIHDQGIPKQAIGDHQNKYDLKIRECLDLQRDFGNPASALQTLDRLFGKIKERITPRSRYNKKEAIEVLKTIGNILKEEGNFEYRKNNLLIEGLKKQENGKRFIDCDDYSSIYLVAGERLGLSLEPVYVPKHVFLKCRLGGNGGFYWEPILSAEKDDCYYKDWLDIEENSGYPKVLNENEFEAIHFCNLGVAWYEKGEYGKAIECYKRAVRLDPDFAEAHNNLGVAYAKKGNYDQALECYNKAASINTKYATPFNNIGVAFYRMGCLQKAVEYFEKAIEADPKDKRAYSYKRITLRKKGKLKKTLTLLNRRKEEK